jgi:hypothetical protein
MSTNARQELFRRNGTRWEVSKGSVEFQFREQSCVHRPMADHRSNLVTASKRQFRTLNLRNTISVFLVRYFSNLAGVLPLTVRKQLSMDFTLLFHS